MKVGLTLGSQGSRRRFTVVLKSGEWINNKIDYLRTIQKTKRFLSFDL